METSSHRAIAIVGVGAVLPDAPNADTFWENIKNGRYSVTDVDPQRWDPALYYDPDPSAPDKTYSKIGGWVREFAWEPMAWHLPVPPKVVDAMDGAQKWAIACTREALNDYGYPKRPLDPNRIAVILGNAMAGEKHYLTAMRIYFPEFARELSEVAGFASLPESLRRDITRDLHDRVAKHLPEISEDSMPGELANCIAGRIANLFNFRGPNFTCDAACASAMAAITSAVEGLVEKDFDVAVTGGIDRNMGASTFVKFCKIGALSPTGSRPFAEGADGFVMGEGSAMFLMKRLTDAERDGDKIYAVLRGIGGSSDGKGKGITAPNPIGQKLAVERGWQNAGLSPATATYFEGHGTSTRVGDVVEAQSMIDVLRGYKLAPHSIGLGSVKSNFGHLKGAAGAAGLLKLTLSLHHKLLPPSVNCQSPTHEIDFAHSPLYVNTELKPWSVPGDAVRSGGLSAFGFGGTNFHAVLEEYIPGRLNGNGRRTIAVNAPSPAAAVPLADAQSTEVGLPSSRLQNPATSTSAHKVPLRGVLVIGENSEAEIAERLRHVIEAAKTGRAPAPAAPPEADLRAAERLAIDYGDAADLASKGANTLKALAANQPAIWKALRAQGIYRGSGPAGKVAFLYPGQGSQYVNMLNTLLDREPIVAETFAEADRVMTPLLGKPLSKFIFVDQKDETAVAKAEDDLRQTAITQPAVLATDEALTRLLAAYGVTPDFTMGHSLGEYGALVAAKGLPFADALEAVSARGREMTDVAMADNGLMAAVFAPIAEIERLLKAVDGYVVIANINSNRQAVIGGASKAVEQALDIFIKAGYEVAILPVSHAFHTSIVAPASQPLRRVLERLRVAPPRLPVVANTNGEFYPTGDDVVPKMLDILAQQVASPVQFIKGLQTLYGAGARVFVEVGPKKALQGFAEDVLGDRGDVISLFTNHPKFGDTPAFNQALCCLYAAGLGRGIPGAATTVTVPAATSSACAVPRPIETPKPTSAPVPASSATVPITPVSGDQFVELGRMFAEVLERGWKIYHQEQAAPSASPVTITGAALGLPGTERVFDDLNIARLLNGEQFIKAIPGPLRQAMVDKHITRLVKNDKGGTFETISDVAEVIKLAGRGGTFDLQEEFGVSADRCAALDRDTQLAIAVGLEALRDAGIPLVMRYKKTSKGTHLPDRWMLPEALRDDTGVIFGSAFPGLDSFADEMSRYHADRARRDQLAVFESLRAQVNGSNGDSGVVQELDRHIDELRDVLKKGAYVFDRRYLFRVLPMGHSQFAEYIGARGPNTALNAACASTTQAVAVAEDWIRAGRCRRVIVVTADDITGDNLIDWMGAGFLASGAAATDEIVEEAALPFDRRRHGMILGMGAAGLVVESAEAARERGLQPICEVLSAVTANSAFHGTRLDVQHISQVMEDVVAKAEAASGIDRQQLAPKTVFVSHETYTPARGGSASAEIFALRKVFGDVADKIVIANSKGYTGHAMGAGIEDVLAVKALETGIVPAVANFKEVDPELGRLNLSRGGAYPVEYALRLGAGFGSQISMTLMRWVANKEGGRQKPAHLGYEYRIADQVTWKTWLSNVAGLPAPNLEVVHRTLRVRDQGPAVRATQVAPGVKATPAPETTPVIGEFGKGAADVKAAPLAPSVAVSSKPQPPVAAPLGVAAVSIAEIPKAVATPAVPLKSAESRQIENNAAAPPNVAPALPATLTDQPINRMNNDAGADAVKERILALAVEKTGYPKDMLDFDLDLEADLGVDTVKQAEMFAAIREIYNIPRDENRKLRDYPTLAHVIRFVLENRSDLAPAGTPANPAETNSAPTSPVPDTIVVVKKQAPAAASPKATNAITADTGAESVKERILALAVEKTGYPQEMLDLDLDLEADLGVDTVKQAEMFAAIREIYDIPRDENRKLRDYPTLAHVIRFVLEKRPDLAGAPVYPDSAKASVSPAGIKQEAKAEPEGSAPAISAPVSPAAEDSSESVKERILALAVEKTGYPQEMLDLDLDLEADLGVDTVKQAEMFAAIREIYNIPRDENRKLRDYPTLAHVIRFVLEKRPDLTAASRSEALVAAAPASIGATAVDNERPNDITTTTAAMASAPLVPAPASQLRSESVKDRILALAVEKTGYPKEMLDLDLDLEADLGVDTVKQAEMFAAIREIYNIPRNENRKLRDYPTLAQVIRFVHEMRPDLSGAAPFPSPAPAIGKKEPVQSVTPEPTSDRPSLDQSMDTVKEKVLDIVAEKTGYPKDMLDLDLDLEADLGIDTVKQAEMFAAIRAAYNIPRDENLRLRDFPSLRHVIQFAQDRSGVRTSKPREPQSGSQEPTASSTPSLPSSLKPKRERLPLASLEAANDIPRRVPAPVLRPPLDLSKSTGVTLGPGQRVIVMADSGGVGKALGQLLENRGVEVLRIEGAPGADAFSLQLNSWAEAGPIHGVYWLPALDNEGRLEELDVTAWHEALRVRVKLLYATMRALYEQIAKAGTFLVSATLLGGQHGYDDAGAVAPLGGSVVGFSKTYKRERPDALVKIVDFEPGRTPSDVAQLLLEETLRDPGAIEIGYKSGLRWSIGLKEQPAVDGQPGMTLDGNTVFLVTGAAGGIVSAITADLAAASGGTFYLLDLVPEPDLDNVDLKRFATDKDGLKRDLFARLQAKGERATPALVEKEIAALERAQAARNAIDAVLAAGGTAHYYSVNLTDARRVTEIISEVRARSGRIDVLLHAAGVERSRPLGDKNQREFDLVFDVKSDGFFNLLYAVANMPVTATVAFSSIAGRFGNRGQADYSSANDLLCKLTSSFRTTRPATRGIAVDWTAWSGIGMASRGSIPKIMEMAGIDMLAPEAAVPVIRRELTVGRTRGEVVIGKGLGVLEKEWDETGGLETSAAITGEQRPVAHGPMAGKIACAGLFSPLRVETTLDPKVQPFLYDHQIDNTPVLPGVMGLEAFAEAASCLLPGWQVDAIEDVKYLAPFKFYRNEPRTVTVEAVIQPQGEILVADCRLLGQRQFAKAEPQIITYFSARTQLSKEPARRLLPQAIAKPSGNVIEATDIYRLYFHGPAYQVVERAWWDGSRIIGLMSKSLPENHWPATLPTLIGPRLIELCFQTAGVWEMGVLGRMGLPWQIDRVQLFGPRELSEDRLYAIVTPDPVRGSFDAQVVSVSGTCYLELRGYRTVAVPSAADSNGIKALQTAMALEAVAA